jgi:arylsulfatase
MITASAADQPDDQRPNIVLMMLDDLGFSDLGCYGASIIQTPTIDRLAQEGLRFSQFYNTSKCHSSRICLLTGLYPFQAGNSSMDQAVTIAEVLQPAGYFTAMTGKWHLDRQPTDRGFQRHFGHLSGATNFFTGDSTFRLNGQPWSEFGDDFYTTDANTDFAIQFIDEAVSRQQPFFMYVAHNAPHYPLQARKEDVLKYRGKFKNVGWDQLRQRRHARQRELKLFDSPCRLSPRPDYIPAWDDLTEEWKDWEDYRMAAYAAMVDRVDQNVKRLVDHLQQHGVWENTLFLLCSDNGACPFERTRGRELPPWNPESYWCYDVGWAHVGNTPFRWYKQNQHEGGIASPLIVHWPNGLKTAPGSVTHQVGHLIDVLPTLAELAGAEAPSRFGDRSTEPVQGLSLVPILRGQERKEHPWLYYLFNDNRAIRRGNWKLVSAEWGRWELYNLSVDRSELNDLASQQPERVAALRQLWLDTAEHVDGAPQRLRRPVTSETPTFPPRQMSPRETK